MKGQALKGHLDVLLLAAVFAGAAHGYALIKRLRDGSGGIFDLPEGTVYPALHRLESTDLIVSSWASVGGRERRVYEITEAGRGALERERSEWGRFSSAVDSILSTG